jgi:ATP-binding cassette, subfamily B, heavy metal transporter
MDATPAVNGTNSRHSNAPGRKAPLLETVRAVLPYLWPRGSAQGDRETRLRVVGALGLLLAGRGLTVLVPFLYAAVVGRLTHSAAAVPVALIVGYGLLQCVSHGMDTLREWVFTPVSLRIARNLTRHAVRHVHDLSLRFHLDRQTGGLTRAVERGSDAIGQISRIVLFNVLPSVLDTVLTIAVVWRLFGWRYVVVIVMALTIYCAVTLRVTQARIGLRRARNDANTAAQHRLVDSLLNYETVKYFGAEAFEDARVDAAQARLEMASRKLQRSSAALSTAQNVIIASATAVIMLMAAHGIADGRFGVGRFVLVNTYLIALYEALTSLGWVYAALRSARVDLEQMVALLDETPEIADAEGARILPAHLDEAGPAAIRFEHVSFGYDAKRPILTDVSFAAEPGASIALVGETGAGKSTIGRLLFRSYDPVSGAILIDGQSIRGLSQASLRAAIGVVPQDTVLFNDTIGFNIAYGRPDTDVADIEHAARLARVHDFIATLPDGYDTLVGERGLKLSGGEKQRIAIARVILKDPRILLLDEATSALDTRTERAILGALRDLSRARTTITIAHRLSSVRHCDEILVLDRGRVVERGTHGALLAAGGRYASMWLAQDMEEAERGEHGDAQRVDYP